MTTHWKKLTNPDYFGSHDLINPDGSYREITVKIKSVTIKEIVGDGGRKSQKNVLVTYETKPIILNNINQRTIQKVLKTPFIEQWKDRQIVIGVDTNVKAFGDVTDALRVRNRVVNELPQSTYEAEMKAISEAKDLSELSALWNALDAGGKAVCLTAKDSRKNELSK
jgi:hypothetical protein